MGTDVQLVPATAAHAEALAPLMRPEDVAEVEALGFATPLQALSASLATSDVAFALLFDGEVAALFGTGTPTPIGRALGEDVIACVWALTGRAVARHPKDFLRASRPALSMLLAHCANLCNWVDARYAGAVRWLKWLGFSVGPARPLVPGGPSFHPICVRRSQWARS